MIERHPRLLRESAAQPVADRAGVHRGHAAMIDGCRFLIARGAHPSAPVRPAVRLRRSGNCLNELDRFLAVLIAECARLAGIAESGLAGDDDVRRRMDTALRLRRIEAHCGHSSMATTRLRAIARIRDLAVGDSMLRPGEWLERDMAVATAGQVTIVASPDKAPDIDNRALAVIAEFYAAIAGQLYAGFAKS